MICVVMEDISVGDNIPLGQAVIGLRGACGPVPISFSNVPIYHNGYEYGWISGQVHVKGTISVQGKLDALNSF